MIKTSKNFLAAISHWYLSHKEPQIYCYNLDNEIARNNTSIAIKFYENREINGLGNYNVHRGLTIATEHGNLTLAKYFIKNGARIEQNNFSVFVIAAKQGHLDLVKYFHEVGADIQANFNEALKLAAQAGQLETVKYLIENGADYHMGNNVAFRWAANNSRHEITNYFLIDLGMTVLPGTRTWLYKHRCKHEFELILKHDSICSSYSHLDKKLPPKGTGKAKQKKI